MLNYLPYGTLPWGTHVDTPREYPPKPIPSIHPLKMKNLFKRCEPNDIRSQQVLTEFTAIEKKL